MTETAFPSVKPTAVWETRLWMLMRLSAILLVPLVWIHVLIQDVLIGVHQINIDYVALRWAMTGWRIYDAVLLAFAFGHGSNGMRQVLEDYIHNPTARRALRIALVLFWIAISGIGAVAVIGGVR
jgi:succinate dehydrogenase / fumarate reductase, membrane anchor subunit